MMNKIGGQKEKRLMNCGSLLGTCFQLGQFFKFLATDFYPILLLMKLVME